MSWIRKLLANREAARLAFELVKLAFDGAKDVAEARRRLVTKAQSGDLDDSLAKLQRLL